MIEYEFQGKRTKYTIGVYSRDGAPGEGFLTGYGMGNCL